MDGSNPISFISGVNEPRGIQIVFQENRLYWTCAGDLKIESSDFDGQDRRTLVKLPRGSWPHGIAVLNDAIIWSDHFSGKFQRSSNE